MTLKIAAAQYPITKHASWEAWEAHTRRWIAEAVAAKAQVLVFPEYGSMELVSLLADDVQARLKAQVAELEKFRAKFIALFQGEAVKAQIAILAPSLPITEADGRVVNRAYFFTSDGKYDFQDKEHMTRFEDEDWGVVAGARDYRVFTAFGAKFGVNVCFDVEFPHAAHELAKKGAQVLLAPSCTESAKGMHRVHVGARARALENQYYVVVAQTVGEATWSQAVDLNTGRAAVYSTCDKGFPDDGVLAIGELNRPCWVFAELDLALIEEVRENGQVFNFRNMKKH